MAPILASRITPLCGVLPLPGDLPQVRQLLRVQLSAPRPQRADRPADHLAAPPDVSQAPRGLTRLRIRHTHNCTPGELWGLADRRAEGGRAVRRRGREIFPRPETSAEPVTSRGPDDSLGERRRAGTRSVMPGTRDRPGFRGLALRTVACDVLVMGGFVLVASVGQQAPVSGSLASHAFWYGVLLALLVAWILPGWVAGLLFVIALLASNLLSNLLRSSGGHAHSFSASSSVPYLIVAVIALVGGLILGRIRGLRQLGQAEYRTRFRNVRGISRWF